VGNEIIASEGGVGTTRQGSGGANWLRGQGGWVEGNPLLKEGPAGGWDTLNNSGQGGTSCETGKEGLPGEKNSVN